jgi:hypothetical protein
LKKGSYCALYFTLMHSTSSRSQRRRGLMHVSLAWTLGWWAQVHSWHGCPYCLFCVFSVLVTVCYLSKESCRLRLRIRTENVTKFEHNDFKAIHK